MLMGKKMLINVQFKAYVFNVGEYAQSKCKNLVKQTTKLTINYKKKIKMKKNEKLKTKVTNLK